jgi:transcriptional regulator with XRE-family HTH domain
MDLGIGHTLAVSGLRRKPDVAMSLFGQVSRMRSDLTRIFTRRLQEEMELRGLSGNALAKRSGVGQRSIARILLPEEHKDKQTPTLDKIDALAKALGVPGWFLLMDANTAEQRVIRAPVAAQPDGVYKLPPPYPPVFSKPKTGKKSRSGTNKSR